jgi:hypothetical protein
MQRKGFEHRGSNLRASQPQVDLSPDMTISGGKVSAFNESGQSQFPQYQQKNIYGSTINWAGGLHYRSNFNKTRD